MLRQRLEHCCIVVQTPSADSDDRWGEVERHVGERRVSPLG